MVPANSSKGTSGVSLGRRARRAGTLVPIDQFHLAQPEKDTAASLNRALSEGKNLLFTPGIYQLDESIVVSRPNAIVLGLGFPSLVAAVGKPALIVEAGEGSDRQRHPG